MFTGTLRRSVIASGILAAALLSSGCATAYVDGGLKNTSLAQVRKPSQPQDTQLLFSFQTKGVANAKATEVLQKEVAETVSSSGLFAVAGPDPAPSGAILNITINNIALAGSEDAYAKGFVTGLTFGLAGSAVSDGYVCTVDYLPPGGRSKITKIAHHAIHTTVGAKGAPANAVKAKSFDDAARTMTRQIITEALKDLSQEATFQ